MLVKLPVLGCFLVIMGFVSPAQAEPHSFSVMDSIRMTRFNTPSENLQTDAPLFSPDRAYFVVITSRGIPETNEIESSIWLYRTNEVRRYVDHGGMPPERRQLARVSAIPESETPSAHAPIIAQVEWSTNSRSLYFLRERTGGNWQLCRIDRRAGVFQSLTKASANVRYYSFTPSIVVYLETVPAKLPPSLSPRSTHEHRDGDQSIRGRSIESLLIPNDPGRPVLAQLWELQGGARRALGTPYVDAGFGGSYTPDVLAIAPNGRTIIHTRPAENVPLSWHDYSPVNGFPSLRIDPASPDAHSAYNSFRPRQYILIDVKNGQQQPMIEAPIAYTLGYADQQLAVWSKDGRKALVTDTFLSSRSDDHEGTVDVFLHPCAAAVLEVASGKVSCLTPSRWDLLDQRTNDEALLLTSASFDEPGDSVTLRFDYPGRRSVLEHYEIRSGHWLQTLKTLTTEPSLTRETTLDQIAVTIQQTVNSRPLLWATDVSHPQGRMIWDPNPNLSSIKMGQASIFHWHDSSGYDWTGGLIKPIGFAAGKRYPLIIQTHGFQTYRFLTDGFYPTGMAAQPLASAGFMVLQMETRRTHYTTSQEAADQILGIDAAIEKLTADGFIDPERVGIAGFSRTCWYVESALVKEPRRFRAGTLADGVDQGYLQYALFGDTANIRGDSETVHGGKPYGENLTQWAQHAPAFQSDRVQTPLLIQALGTRSILMEWEIYDSLYQQGKPVDMILLPKAQHVLQSPEDLYASEQGIVDWFLFWLQNYERPDPRAQPQYVRWRAIKAELKLR